MACGILPFLMTWNSFVGHSSTSFSKCNLSNVSAAFFRVSTDTAHCTVPRQQLSFLYCICLCWLLMFNSVQNYYMYHGIGREALVSLSFMTMLSCMVAIGLAIGVTIAVSGLLIIQVIIFNGTTSTTFHLTGFCPGWLGWASTSKHSFIYTLLLWLLYNTFSWFYLFPVVHCISLAFLSSLTIFFITSLMFSLTLFLVLHIPLRPVSHRSEEMWLPFRQ